MGASSLIYLLSALCRFCNGALAFYLLVSTLKCFHFVVNHNDFSEGASNDKPSLILLVGMFVVLLRGCKIIARSDSWVLERRKR